MQLLPILLIVAAWFLIRWLIRRHRAELKADSIASKAEFISRENLQSLSLEDLRAALQRLAMDVTRKGIPPIEKARVKALIKEFAAEDPLVARVAEIAQALAIANPGFVQSKSYAAFPNLSVDDVRYGMYFAHELGLIVRVKHGNSYRIYSPETIRHRVLPTP